MPVLSPFESELTEASVTLTSTLIERLVQHQGVEKVCGVQSPWLPLSFWSTIRCYFNGDDHWPNMANPMELYRVKLIVSCPACTCLPMRNGLVNEVEFLRLTFKKW